jgi:hypothetical protein
MVKTPIGVGRILPNSLLRQALKVMTVLSGRKKGAPSCQSLVKVICFVGAVRPHHPEIHVGVDLTAEGDPLAVRRGGDFRLVVQVVGETLDVASVEIGDIELGALRILVRL